jgi:hypothetical protein
MTLTEQFQPLLSKRLPAALVVGMLFAGAPVWAGDHLEPVMSVASLDEFVRYVFADAFKQDVIVRAYIDRSWYPPDMVGISKRHGVHRIFALHPTRELPDISDELPPEPFAVEGPGGVKTTITPARRKWPPVRGMAHCEIALDTTLAERIESVWTQMVLATRRSPSPAGGADGTSYTFGTTSPEKQGWIWTPQPATKPGMLAQIAETMIGYCKSRNGKDLAELTAQVASLGKRIE